MPDIRPDIRLDMKANDPNLSSLAATGTSRTQTARSTGAGQNIAQNLTSGAGASSDDIHLSELVRSLRAMAPDSPDRQARIEQIARDYSNGTYRVDAHATASKIIDDATEP